MLIRCAACSDLVELPEKVGFRDTCPSCDAWLHSCVNCGFWEKDRCTEPSAERVGDPEGQNFCEWYRGIEADSTDKRDHPGGRGAAEDLWKKLTKKK